MAANWPLAWCVGTYRASSFKTSFSELQSLAASSSTARQSQCSCSAAVTMDQRRRCGERGWEKIFRAIGCRAQATEGSARASLNHAIEKPTSSAVLGLQRAARSDPETGIMALTTTRNKATFRVSTASVRAVFPRCRTRRLRFVDHQNKQVCRPRTPVFFHCRKNACRPYPRSILCACLYQPLNEVRITHLDGVMKGAAAVLARRRGKKEGCQERRRRSQQGDARVDCCHPYVILAASRQFWLALSSRRASLRDIASSPEARLCIFSANLSTCGGGGSRRGACDPPPCRGSLSQSSR